MTDDIKTLRNAIECLPYTEKRNEALAALERVAAELAASNESIKSISRLWNFAEAERVALREKLRMAQEALTGSADRIEALEAENVRLMAERDCLASELRIAMQGAGYSEWAIDENMRRLYSRAALTEIEKALK